MGAKPRDSKSAARTAIKRSPAKRVPPRKAAGKPARGGGRTVDGYVAALAGWRKEAAQRLRDVIRAAAPGCSESIKWGQPVYEDSGPFCYFRAGADHLTFGFWRGAQLDDPQGRLEGSGDDMRHIKIRSVEEASDEALSDFVRQAVALNRELGSPTAGGGKAARAAAPAVETAEAVEPVEDAQIEAVETVAPVPPAEPIATPADPIAPAPPPAGEDAVPVAIIEPALDEGWDENESSF